VGYTALGNNVDGFRNVAVGAYALMENSSGSHNAAVGSFALDTVTTGSNNTAVGDQAGAGLTTGDGNVYLGYQVGATSTDTNVTRIRNIGSTPIVGGINVVVSGTGGNGDQILGYVSSSRRYKQDVEPMDRASEGLFALKPVTFRAKGSVESAQFKHYGLIAEDVAAVNPDLVVYNSKGKPETLRFDSINAMLLNEFLKEHAKVQKLEAALERVNRRLEGQQIQIANVRAHSQLESSSQPEVASNH
jgi:hypothetical protein